MRLPPGEKLVQHRQVADHHGDEADARPGLQHRQQTRRAGVRHHVAIAEGEEGDAAHVGLLGEGRAAAALRRPLQQAEADDQAGRPQREQQKHGQRAEQAEHVLPPRQVGDA